MSDELRRERRCRRLAEKQGFRVMKLRRHPWGYWLLYAGTNTVMLGLDNTTTFSLDELEGVLK